MQNKHIYIYLLSISIFLSFSSIAFAQDSSEKQNRLNFLNLSGYSVRSVVTNKGTEPAQEITPRKPEERYKIVEVTPTKPESHPIQKPVQTTAKTEPVKTQTVTSISTNIINKKPGQNITKKSNNNYYYKPSTKSNTPAKPAQDVTEPIVYSKAETKPVAIQQPVAPSEEPIAENDIKNSHNEDSELNIVDYPVKESLKEPLNNNKPVKEPNLISVFFSLLFVIMLAPLLALAYKKLRGVKSLSRFAGKLGTKDSDQFNLLTSTSLGQGKNVHLIEINGKKLVVGSTDSNINLLTEIPEEESFDESAIDESFLYKAYKDQEIKQTNTATEIEPEISKTQKETKPEPEENVEFTYPENYEYNYADVYKEYLQKADSETDSTNDYSEYEAEEPIKEKPKTRRTSTRKTKK